MTVPKACGLALRFLGQQRTLLLAIVTATLVACANVGLEAFDAPDVELLGLAPLPSQGMEARFQVRLRIVNPNPIALEIDGMAYEVFLRDSKVLTGASNQEVVIDAYSEGTAELEVAAGMLGSLALIRDLMSAPPEDGLPYRLEAKLSRKGLGGSMRVEREGVLNLDGGR